VKEREGRKNPSSLGNNSTFPHRKHGAGVATPFLRPVRGGSIRKEKGSSRGEGKGGVIPVTKFKKNTAQPLPRTRTPQLGVKGGKIRFRRSC